MKEVTKNGGGGVQIVVLDQCFSECGCTAAPCHLGACQQCKFLGLSADLLNRIWGWGPVVLKFQIHWNRAQNVEKMGLFKSAGLGNNSSNVIEYPVLKILSPGNFVIVVGIYVSRYNCNEKKFQRLDIALNLCSVYEFWFQSVSFIFYSFTDLSLSLYLLHSTTLPSLFLLGS